MSNLKDVSSKCFIETFILTVLIMLVGLVAGIWGIGRIYNSMDESADYNTTKMLLANDMTVGAHAIPCTIKTVLLENRSKRAGQNEKIDKVKITYVEKFREKEDTNAYNGLMLWFLSQPLG